MLNDPRKSLSFTYNSLNLPDEANSCSTVKAKYVYSYDGVKVKVQDAGGTNGYDYLGSLTLLKASGTQTPECHFGDGIIRGTQVMYFEKDYLGSVRAVLNTSGTVLEKNDYYPFGMRHANASHVVTANNRYKFNGKEDQTVGTLGLLDYGARMYDAQIGRWLTVDPLAEKHYPESPYAYVHNSPMIHIDPDGKDGLVVISGNRITIKSNIILTGSRATTELANIYKRDIMDNWGSMRSYTHNGTKYDITWDVNVRVAQPGEKIVFDGVNNYMEVMDDPTFRSKVMLTNSGKIRPVESELFSPMAHEFGHMIGLKDKYIDTPKGSKPISKYWEGNIMSELAGLGDVDDRNMKILLEKPLEWHRLKKLLNPDKKEEDNSIFKTDPFDFFQEDLYFWINFKNREF